jgi:alpha-amylase/alpha-mannosidase (GH57 family)
VAGQSGSGSAAGSAGEQGAADPLRADWLEVGGCQIDPTRPYRCYLPDLQGQLPTAQPSANQQPVNQRRYIDIFFYDGPISRDMGFNDVLNSSQLLAARLRQVVSPREPGQPLQLISVATDGETFGHHKPDSEKALAYAFLQEFPNQGLQVTNYAHYLSLHSPTWEVELKPVTAWSCAHGVDRWQDDCGCGGEGGVWHQQWRKPLRQSLDWLRDQLTKIFTTAAGALLLDPWQARDQYIEVILSRGLNPSVQGIATSETVERFLAQHQRHALSPGEQIDALRLLEMQRMALLMYTSCGWFFEEISRPEGTQILRYAGRAIVLAEALTGQSLEAAFIQQLSHAPSNVELFGTGAEVYRQLVQPGQINLEQVAAHFAISSLFANYPNPHRLFCYQIQQQDYHLQRMGVLTLAVGQLQVTSELTRETAHLNVAVLHLGGWDFHCVVQADRGRAAYSQLKQHLMTALKAGSAAQIVLAMTEGLNGSRGLSGGLGRATYNLSDLFPEERQRLMTLLTQETLTRLEQLYNQVYRDNYGMLLGWRRDGLAVPEELQVAAQITLSHRLNHCVHGLEQALAGRDWWGQGAEASSNDYSNYFSALASTATEAQALGCKLNLDQVQPVLERLVLDLVWQWVHRPMASASAMSNPEPSWPSPLLVCLQRLMQAAHQLELQLNIDAAQELCWQSLRQLAPRELTPQARQQLQAFSHCLRVVLPSRKAR